MRVQPLPAVILATFAALGVGIVLSAVFLYTAYAGSLPEVTALEDYTPDEGSLVVSADGRELATFAATNRRVVDYDEIPDVLVEATVAAEDHTFWDNPCVDPRAIVRAWLGSPSHRRILLEPAFRVAGIGIAAGTPVADVSGGATYTADFGS